MAGREGTTGEGPAERALRSPRGPPAPTMAELREVNEQLLIAGLREQEVATALEAERAQLAVILAGIGDAVLVVDEAGTPVRTNAAYARMTGGAEAPLVPEDAQGSPLPPAKTPQARAARGETFSLDFTLPAADGSRCWYEANGQPLHNGGAGHAVVVIRDITLSSQHRRLMAQEEERRRVSYEVHDGLAATAASAHQHLQAFARHHRPRSPRAREQFDRALELAQRTVREARRVVANLRPTTLDDLGLAAALRLQVEELQAEGWHVTYQEALGSERVPPLVETALFRVTQEALTNARKHAQTTEIHVRVERAEREVRLVVEDAGRGFVPEAITPGAGAGERVGLAGMRERVVMLGGQCLVEGHLGAGTRVSVAIPLEPLAAEGMARDT